MFMCDCMCFSIFIDMGIWVHACYTIMYTLVRCLPVMLYCNFEGENR